MKQWVSFESGQGDRQHGGTKRMGELLCDRRLVGRWPSLVYCSDDESGKAIAAGLIRHAGFVPVGAGPLRIARYTEPFSLLIAQLVYEGEGARNWPTGSSGSRIKTTN